MKYVIVTGARGGMGTAVVNRLISEGYFVFALDREIEESIADSVHYISVDVTDTESIERARGKIKGVTDKVYAIVHLAGIYVLDSLVEMDEERFIRAFDVNLFGVYRINKIMLPLLCDGSRIIITSSELAPLDPLPFTGVYAITKGAIEKYAYSLRMELQLLGISVAVVRPGAIKTSLLDVSTAELDRFVEKTELYAPNADRFKRIVESVEARNLPPEKVANVVFKAIRAKKPRFVYNLNRNPLLLLLNILPKRLATFIIKKILK